MVKSNGRKIGLKNIASFEQLQRLNNAVVLIDEPQLHLPTANKKLNDALLKLLTISRQKDIKLIFSTSDSRYFQRSIESYIDIWIVLDLDYELVKQGSKIKKVIKEFSLIDASDFRLNLGEYLFYSRLPQFKEARQLYNFSKPKWYTEDISTAKRIESISILPVADFLYNSQKETPTGAMLTLV